MIAGKRWYDYDQVLVETDLKKKLVAELNPFFRNVDFNVHNINYMKRILWMEGSDFSLANRMESHGDVIVTLNDEDG